MTGWMGERRHVWKGGMVSGKDEMGFQSCLCFTARLDFRDDSAGDEEKMCKSLYTGDG